MYWRHLHIESSSLSLGSKSGFYICISCTLHVLLLPLLQFLSECASPTGSRLTKLALFSVITLTLPQEYSFYSSLPLYDLTNLYRSMICAINASLYCLSKILLRFPRSTRCSQPEARASSLFCTRKHKTRNISMVSVDVFFLLLSCWKMDELTKTYHVHLVW